MKQRLNKHKRRIVQVMLSITIVTLLVSSIILSVQVFAKNPKQKVNPLQRYHTVSPATSSDVLLNPGKGWVLYGSPSKQSAATLAAATVGYDRYDWSQIEPKEGQYNWSMIDYDLNAWATAGKQFAFGVMNANSSDGNVPYVTPQWVFADGAASVKSSAYDDVQNISSIQYVPVWNDPIFLQKVQDFVTALAQRYDNNPRIAFVDIRSYGNWGEQHVYGISPSVALNSNDTQKHIQIYQNAFKHTQLIVPWGTSNYNTAYSYATNNGIGMRRDGIMVDSTGSELTRAYGKAPSVYEFYGSYQWLVANGYWNANTLTSDLNIGKPSYIGMGQWGNDAQVMLANEPALISQLANKMGYYFVLSSAKVPDTITNNQAVTVSMSWNNQGVAYLSKQAYVAVAVLDSNNNVVQKIWFANSNPRGWTPGQKVTETTSMAFSGVPSGTYKLAVGLFQSTTDTNPSYKIGNQGLTNNGWYVLSSSIAVA